jgi:hypothetical protein
MLALRSIAAMRGFLELVTRFGGIVIIGIVVFSHALTQGDDNLRIQNELNKKAEDLNQVEREGERLIHNY